MMPLESLRFLCVLTAEAQKCLTGPVRSVDSTKGGR